MPRPLALLLLALVPCAARALCTSEGAPQPAAVLERFTSADCAECWRAVDTPRPPRGAIAIDWVLPGARGEDAPLSAVALPEAAQRRAGLGPAAPQVRQRSGPALPLRLAHGEAVNDYIAASVRLDADGGPWSAWVLLVEKLPAGLEGSPVERLLVRNVFRPDWSTPAARRTETRAMQIHAGAQADRLRLVAIVEDARGRIRAIRQSECR